MTREDLIRAWWPHVEHTLLEAVALWQSGGEPRRRMELHEIGDEVPTVVKIFLRDAYHRLMDTLLDLKARGQDSYWVQKSEGIDEKLARPWQPQALREVVELPKLGVGEEKLS